MHVSIICVDRNYISIRTLCCTLKAIFMWAFKKYEIYKKIIENLIMMVVKQLKPFPIKIINFSVCFSHLKMTLIFLFIRNQAYLGGS